MTVPGEPCLVAPGPPARPQAGAGAIPYPALFEGAPLAMACLSAPDGLIAEANVLFRRLAGGEPVGRRLAEIPALAPSALARAGLRLSVGEAETGGTLRLLAIEPLADDAVLRDLAQMRSALEAAGLGDWSWEAADDGIRLSDRAGAILGLPAETALGWTDIHRRLAPRDAERAPAVLAEALSRGVPYAFDARTRRQGDRAGTWFTMRGHVSYAPDGSPVSLAGVVQDVTAREEARRTLRAREQRLRVATAVAALGIFEWHILDDRALWENERMWEIFGRRPQDGTIGKVEFFRSVLHPDDVRPFNRAVTEALRSEGVLHVSCRIRRGGDGALRYIDFAGRFERDRPDGLPRRLIGVVADVTDRRLAEERQALLIRELHHRVKNTLATVQAVVGATARSAPSIQAFYDAFVGRIMSLAHTHSVLTEDTWQTASLRSLIENELKPYADPPGTAPAASRISLEGPAIDLPSELAVPIGMAIHELTTNAAKHGALRTRAGRLAVTWGLAGGAGDPAMLTFEWRESGGPAVEPPTRQGFGSRLLERVLSAQVQARVTTTYDPEGLRLTMTAPLPARNAALNPLAGV